MDNFNKYHSRSQLFFFLSLFAILHLSSCSYKSWCFERFNREDFAQQKLVDSSLINYAINGYYNNDDTAWHRPNAFIAPFPAIFPFLRTRYLIIFPENRASDTYFLTLKQLIHIRDYKSKSQFGFYLVGFFYRNKKRMCAVFENPTLYASYVLLGRRTIFGGFKVKTVNINCGLPLLEDHGKTQYPDKIEKGSKEFLLPNQR